MKEKQLIEKLTAEYFLTIYNNEFQTHYKIIEYSDAPDIITQDTKNGDILNIEVTMTQDKDKDIQSLLGRSEHRNPNSIKEKVKKIKTRELHYMDAITSYNNHTLPMLFNTIRKKLKKDYGKSVLLVIRDTSPLSWDHSVYIDDISKEISTMAPNPQKIFDKGIWLISSDLSQIYKLSPQDDDILSDSQSKI